MCHHTQLQLKPFWQVTSCSLVPKGWSGAWKRRGMRKVSLANEAPVIPAHFSIGDSGGGGGGGGVPWKHAALGIFKAYFVICKWEGPDKPLYFPGTEDHSQDTSRSRLVEDHLQSISETITYVVMWFIYCFFSSVYFGNLKPAFESSIATCKIPLSSLPTPTHTTNQTFWPKLPFDTTHNYTCW